MTVKRFTFTVCTCDAMEWLRTTCINLTVGDDSNFYCSNPVPVCVRMGGHVCV